MPAIAENTGINTFPLGSQTSVLGLDIPGKLGGAGRLQEHLASRTEAWVDFMADTGDGGNPTYAVARSLAAPQLPVNTPAHLSDLAERLSARPAPDGTTLLSHLWTFGQWLSTVSKQISRAKCQEH